MTQETRKDPRAKVLTMTVRYKSATVDEFIEQYSLDISRGGIFIKTSSPFAPGTLLKFEIRIAEDRTVLQGVGRVVWKRDPADAGNARPAGMGVKFIKLDDASKQVIEDLVARHEDSGSAYESGLAASDGTAASMPAFEGSAQGEGSTPPRKATMIGLGGLDAAAVIAAAQAEAAEAGSEGEKAEEGSSSFFPETDSEAEMPPPGERTVMRQAAELLQEALLGAGGTMDEIGAIGAEPLVDETGQGTAIELTKSPSPSAYPPPRSSASSQSLKAVPAEVPSMDSPAEPAEASDEPAEAEAEAREATPEPAKVASEKPAAISPPPPQVAPAAQAKSASASSGNRGLIYLGAIAAAAAGIYFMFGGSSSPAPEPPVTVNAPPVETAEPVKETPAPVEETMESEGTVKEEEPAVASDEKPAEPSAAASATAVPVEPEPPTKPAAVTLEKKPAPAPKPEKEAPVEAVVEKPTPAPKPVVKKPAETETKPAATEAKPAAEKAPAPKPKPAQVDDDNPY